MRAASTDGLAAGAAGALGFCAAPLFHAAWLFAAGVVVARYFWVNPSWLLVAMAVTALLCAVAAVRAQRVLWCALALLWILLGSWCARMAPQPVRDAQVAALSDGLLRTMEGTVVSAGPLRAAQESEQDESPESEQRPREVTQSFDLQLSTIEIVDDQFDGQRAAAGRVRLTVRWPASGASPRLIRCGEQVRVFARLLQPEVYRDAGAWNRQDYLVEQGITSSGSLTPERMESVRQPEKLSYTCRLANLQHAASARLMALPAAMRALPLPAWMRIDAEDAAMLAAMVTGDRSFLTHSLRVGFERTGSFHMLVVSGFHLAIFSGLLFWLARRLRLPEPAAILFTIAISFAYALFTGFATPVQRSLLMVTLYLLARLVNRERSPMNAIGFAALVLLSASPDALFDSSFQMTLLAVLSIGGIAAPLLNRSVHSCLKATRDLGNRALDVHLEPRIAAFRVALRLLAEAVQASFRSQRARRIAWQALPWLVRSVLRVAELVVVSCVVELAMALPMAIDFHRITLTALPVNLLILPILSVLMPAALLTLALLAVAPAVALLPAVCTALFLHLGVGLVHLFGSLAWGDFRIPSPMLWQSFAFCLCFGAAMVLASLRSRWRRLTWPALLLAALCAVCPRQPQHPDHALLAEAIDVGQGDSMLLMTPDGRSMLVDGGGYTGGPRAVSNEYDIGEEVVSPALWARGLRRLDVVVLSHAHSDHMGGLPAVLRNFHPAELWVGDNPPSEAYAALLQLASDLHIRVRALHAGEDLTLGAAQVRVLAPLAGYRPGRAAANNDSLVLHVAFGASSVQLEGDAEAPVERGMTEEGNLASTLLKVGHHGSVNATTPEFLAQVQPKMAVISAGRNNRFGHPRPEILEALQQAGVLTYRTDLTGAICFELGEDGSRRAYACSR